MIPMLARTRMGLAAARAALPSPVVLVPTMGALHDGHRALLRRAREIAQPDGAVVVSVFVNPLQFGAGEDLERYPRTPERDLAICGAEGAAVMFAPDPAEIYPDGQMITVNPGAIGRVLEGASRPGFFDGMLTVVLKLFHLAAPQTAVFGQKDAQQLALVRRMTAEFNLGLEIVGVPTVRDPDGLAISSRNAHLSAAERGAALALPQALRAAQRAMDRDDSGRAQLSGLPERAADRSAHGGSVPDAGPERAREPVAGCGPEAALAAARAVLDAAASGEPPLVTDYLALADPVSFAEVGSDHTGEALLLVAATVGKTRLIDNTALTFGGRA